MSSIIRLQYSTQHPKLVVDLSFMRGSMETICMETSCATQTGTFCASPHIARGSAFDRAATPQETSFFGCPNFTSLTTR